MSRRLTAVIYGAGAMGGLCARMLCDKGVQVVGAVTRTSNVGADLGELAGLGRPLGVVVDSDAEAVLAKQPVDIALVCTATRMADVIDHLECCVRHGINVITTAEELLYPWRMHPEMSERLDRLARNRGVTILGSGYTDYYWGGEVMQLAGTCHSISRMEGMGRFNIDDYGAAVAQNNLVGASTKDFATIFEAADEPSFLQAAGDLLCAGLGLRVTHVAQSVQPATQDVDMMCRALGRVIEAGRVTGKLTKVDMRTSEGVELHLELQERLYRDGEVDVNRWVVHGEPKAVLENPSPATDFLTCATLVNRIPDVLGAAPGIATVDQLPKLAYRPESLNIRCQELFWGDGSVD